MASNSISLIQSIDDAKGAYNSKLDFESLEYDRSMQKKDDELGALGEQ